MITNECDCAIYRILCAKRYHILERCRVVLIWPCAALRKTNYALLFIPIRMVAFFIFCVICILFEFFPASCTHKWLSCKNFCGLLAVFCLQRMRVVFADFTEFERYCTPLGSCIVNHHDFLVCPLRSSEPSHDEGRTGSIKTYGNANRANIGYGANSEFEHAVLCLRQWACTRTRLYCLFTNSGIWKADI